jgi:hypothetical protein
MDEIYDSQDRHELTREQHDAELNEFLMTEDLATQIDVVDAALSKLSEEFRASKRIHSERLQDL